MAHPRDLRKVGHSIAILVVFGSCNYSAQSSGSSAQEEARSRSA